MPTVFIPVLFAVRIQRGESSITSVSDALNDDVPSRRTSFRRWSALSKPPLRLTVLDFIRAHNRGKNVADLAFLST